MRRREKRSLTSWTGPPKAHQVPLDPTPMSDHADRNTRRTLPQLLVVGPPEMEQSARPEKTSHLLVGGVGQGQVIKEVRAVIPLSHVLPPLSVEVTVSLALSFPALSQSTPQIIINIINKNERQVIKCKICRVPPRTLRAVHKRDGLILLLIQTAS